MAPPPLQSSISAAENSRSRNTQNLQHPNLNTHLLSKSISQRPTSNSSLLNPNIASGRRHCSTNTRNPHFAQSDSKRTNKLKCGALGGLGCGVSSPAPVSGPEFIRSAADWKANNVRKMKQRKPPRIAKLGNAADVVVVQPDVCCGPGIGFGSDSALVDCVEARRPVTATRTNHRQRPSSTRRITTLEHVPMLQSDSTFARVQSRPGISSGRVFGRIQRRSPGGLSELVMFQGGLLSGRSFEAYDSYGDWRVDVDNMTYEELLALSDKIGYVGTGLREEDIFRCIRKAKHSIMESLPLIVSQDSDRNCSICQEEYEEDEEVGKLECGHYYHVNCIKQWLLQKDACPVCKTAAAGH